LYQNEARLSSDTFNDSEVIGINNDYLNLSSSDEEILLFCSERKISIKNVLVLSILYNMYRDR